jgi:DNA invertase Pin-like site-specific DNA recombinase
VYFPFRNQKKETEKTIVVPETFTWEQVQSLMQQRDAYAQENAELRAKISKLERQLRMKDKDILIRRSDVTGRKKTLTDSQIEQIREKHLNGQSLRSLGKEYNVSHATIKNYLTPQSKNKEALSMKEIKELALSLSKSKHHNN